MLPDRVDAAVLNFGPMQSSWGRQLLQNEAKSIATQFEQNDLVLWLPPVSSPLSVVTHTTCINVNADQNFFGRGDICMSVVDWPLVSDSLDHVVLQHPVESGLPLPELLSEATRVLKPERHLWLFICGPLSLSRLRMKIEINPTNLWLPLLWPRGIVKLLEQYNCAEIEQFTLKNFMRSTNRSIPFFGRDWPGIYLIHACKRRPVATTFGRSLSTLNTKGFPSFKPAPAARVESPIQ